MEREAQGTGPVRYRWTFNGAQFDELGWVLTVRGEGIEIERQPLEVLACLLRHSGEVVTKDELLEAAWPGRVVVEGALTNAIGKLRKALGDEDRATIATVSRVGYRLQGKVERKSITRGAIAAHLKAGDAVPRRSHWRLQRMLDLAERGEVWLAEHDKTHVSRVFKFSFDGGRLHALKREATISRLLHDSLGDRDDFVRVLDWDFEDAPYFIESEYGGPNLEEWAQEQGGLPTMALAQRVALLAEVADAVAEAHEVGVLHKDLKPANLLVRGEPGCWHPTLVDFGSGRVLDPERLDALGITRLGITQTQGVDTDSLTGTPLYLAPELLAGQVPTVRSDVYALGVILYQLCVGDLRRPMSAGWENEIDDAFLREDIASAANGNPELRFVSARELAHRLRTRAERQQQLDADLAAKAHVAQTERALAATRARRPWVVAALAILTIGFGVTYGLYRKVADAEAKATNEVHVARAVNQFLNQDLLAAANPVRGGRVDVTVREALDKAAPTIDIRFAGEPRVAATVHQTAAEAYYQLSDFNSAQTHFEDAARLFARADGAHSLNAIQALALQAMALAHGGKLDQARVLLDQVEPDVMRMGSAAPMLRVHADSARGWLEFNSLHFAEAVAALENAVQLLAGLPDADPNIVSTVEQALISARSRAGLPSETLEETQRRILAQLEGQQGRSAPLTLGARHLLARIQVLRGDGRAMEQTYIDLVKDFSRVLGPENENTLQAMHGLANIYTKLERWKDCERQARLAYDGLNRLVGPDHISTLNAQNTLAVAEFRQGKLDKAGDLLELGIEQLQGQSGKLSGLLLAAFELNLAHVRLAEDRVADAQALVSEIKTHGVVLLENDTDAAGELAYLEGRVMLANGDRAGGEAQLQNAISLLAQQNPNDYWIIRAARSALSEEEAKLAGSEAPSTH